MYYQCGVGVVKIEVVRYYSSQFMFGCFGYDVQICSLFIQFFDVDIWCDKIVFQYQQRVDSFLYVCGIQ